MTENCDKALDWEECPRCRRITLKYDPQLDYNKCHYDKCQWHDGDMLTFLSIPILESYLRDSTNVWEKKYFKRLIQKTIKAEDDFLKEICGSY